MPDEKPNLCLHEWNERIIHVQKPTVLGGKYIVYTEWYCYKCGKIGNKNQWETEHIYTQE